MSLWIKVQNSEGRMKEWNNYSAEKRTSFHFQTERGSRYSCLILSIYTLLVCVQSMECLWLCAWCIFSHIWTSISCFPQIKIIVKIVARAQCSIIMTKLLPRVLYKIKLLLIGHLQKSMLAKVQKLSICTNSCARNIIFFYLRKLILTKTNPLE